MSFLRRFKTIGVLLVTALVVYVGLLNVADRAGWETTTDGVEWVQTARGVEVLEANALDAGALLLNINGIPVGSIDELIRIREFLSANLPKGAPASYTVELAEGGQASVPIEIRRSRALEAVDLVLAAVAFGFLAIGLLIFLRSWNRPGALHFYLLCLSAFVVFLFRHSGRADLFDLLVYWLNATALLLLPALFIHFCLVFPRPFNALVKHPALAALLYLPGASLLAFYAVWFTGALQPYGLARNENLAGLLDRVHLVHFSVLVVAGGVVMFLQAGRVQVVLQRQQLKWIGIGTLAGLLPFCALYAIPFIAGWTVAPWMALSVLSLLVIPLGFGYAIARYRLMDVDLIFRRSAAYLLSSSALLGIYVGIVVLLGRVIQAFSPGSDFVVFSAGALVVAVLFAPIKNLFQGQLDRYFYKDRYDLRRSFAEFGRTLNSEIRLPALIQLISDRISQTLGLSQVGIFLRQGSGVTLFRSLVPDSESGQEDQVIDLSEQSLLEATTTSIDNLIAVSSEDEQAPLKELQDWGYRYVRVLQVHDRIIGFLALGRRIDLGLLSTEDLEMVELLADYAAMALDNAVLYRSLETNASQLEELKVYSENVVESIAVGVLVVTPSGEITVWNNALERVYGLKREETLGRTIEELFPEDLLSTLRQFLDGPGWTVTRMRRLHKTFVQTRGGKGRMVNLTLAPFMSQNGFDQGSLVVFDDVTEKVQLENQLLQAEKLSSIGLFAAGIAHEVNTPLAGISSYIQMLLRDTPDDDRNKEILKRIESQSFRASDIVNNLLNFARVDDTDFKELNLNSVMTDTASLLVPALRKSGVEIDLALDPGLPATVGSGGKLQQVFMNLFLNARDAMPDGGRIRVQTYEQHSNLYIQIKDSGQGISRENIEKIYDPFFTTKEIGKGTGLGLSVSYGIIQEHSGRIAVDSEQGRGTTFTIQLPLKRLQ